jgi:hypothetical protein
MALALLSASLLSTTATGVFESFASAADDEETKTNSSQTFQ